MQCEMCGKESSLIKSLIEGVTLNVCAKCGKHGKVVPDFSKRKVNSVNYVNDSKERVVLDYAHLIKKARESKGWKHKDLGHKMAERESVVSRVESGAMKPSLRLAKRFEKVLGISLIIEEDFANVEIKKSKNSQGMTIGDLLGK